jgi:hypothetical protein
MSAYGTKQTLTRRSSISASEPLSDINASAAYVAD